MSIGIQAKAKPRAREPGRLAAAVGFPLAAFVLQSVFWEAIQPYVWFLFFPAVFFSSWVDGLRGGLVATVLSAVLVWYRFIPPQSSFAVHSPMALVSIGTFVGMGILFSLSHDRLRKANRQAAEALAAARSANELLQAANAKVTRLYEQTLRESEARFELILQTSPNALLVVAANGRIVRVNPPAERLFGYAKGTFRGLEVDALVPEGLRKDHARHRQGYAWKYTAGTAQPLIRVHGQRDGAETSFHIVDNGAGFDEKHANRLFQPFQRLHREDEFPGLGIGLATVQRIVHRHGGTIRATASPRQGATFVFTLPSDDQPLDTPT